MIEAIHPEQVVEVWQHAEPDISAALARSGEYTAHDMLVKLVTGNAQLWLVYGAWAITEIQVFPRKRVALLTALGGVFAKDHVREMRDVLYQWARHYQAEEIRIVGRRGWLRYLPECHETTVLTCSLPRVPSTPLTPSAKAA